MPRPVPSALPGILLLTFGLFLMPLKDALAKLTGGAYSPALIIWAQFAFMFLAYLPIVVWRYGWGQLVPRPLGWQLIRGLSIVSAIGLFYWAILLIPLADATAMAFVAPLFVTALSPLVLKEKVGFRRWIAVLIGFLGVLLVLRPGFEGERTGYLIALATGFLLGFFYLGNRRLADAAPPIASITYSALIGAVVLLPALPVIWTPPRPGDGALILWFLVIALAAQSCVVWSFRYAPASVLALFHYSQIIGATLFGYLFFRDLPDGVTVAGIAVVIAAGVYIAIREGRAGVQSQ